MRLGGGPVGGTLKESATSSSSSTTNCGSAPAMPPPLIALPRVVLNDSSVTYAHEVVVHQLGVCSAMSAGSTPRSKIWQRPEVQGDGATTMPSMIRSPLRSPASDDSNARSRSRMPADMRSCSRVAWLAPSTSTVMTSSSNRLTTSTAPRCCCIDRETGLQVIEASSSIHANAIANAGRRREDFAQATVAGRCYGHIEQVVAATIGVGPVFIERAHQQGDTHADHIVPVGDAVSRAVLIDDHVAVGVDAVLQLDLLDAFDQFFSAVQSAATPQ